MVDYSIRAESTGKPKVEETKFFLACRDCGAWLQMAENGTLYCPKCKKGELENPTAVLCCLGCNNPLRVTALSSHRFGSYCKSCDFKPTMQDTFLRKI